MAATSTLTTIKTLQTGLAVRLAARNKTLTTQTSGLAPSYLQANLIVLPSRYAADFRLLCARNPVPCPLLAESALPGDSRNLKSAVSSGPGGPRGGRQEESPRALPVAADIDLRHDFPAYRVYVDGVLAAGGDRGDVEAEWTADHVGFLIGCSYSFEEALCAAGLPPRHTLQGRNVPMYRTSVPLMSAGVFSRGTTMVVSMRPYRASEVERVREVTRRFGATHGEPVDWGWDGAARLGIADVGRPEFGEPPLRLDGSGGFFGPGPEGWEEEDGFVPVFWGCGVTPQEAVRQAQLEGVVMAHSPGHMVVLDLTDREVFPL